MKFLALFLLVANSAQAGGSLWCALMRAPTELQEKHEMPYSEIQIDLLAKNTIQVFETDHYRDGKTTTQKLEWAPVSPRKEISGIALGMYQSGATQLEITVNEKGIIVLSNAHRCEVPGDYKKSYSKDIQIIP